MTDDTSPRWAMDAYRAVTTPKPWTLEDVEQHNRAERARQISVRISRRLEKVA